MFQCLAIVSKGRNKAKLNTMSKERRNLLASIGVMQNHLEGHLNVILKIDNPEEFERVWKLQFTPPKLDSDKQAEESLFNMLNELLEGDQEKIQTANLIYEGLIDNTIKTKFYNYWAECHSTFGKDETSGEVVNVYTAQKDIEYLLNQYK